jgi:hypothetical protein
MKFLEKCYGLGQMDTYSFIKYLLSKWQQCAIGQRNTCCLPGTEHQLVQTIQMQCSKCYSQRQAQCADCSIPDFLTQFGTLT